MILLGAALNKFGPTEAVYHTDHVGAASDDLLGMVFHFAWAYVAEKTHGHRLGL